MNNPLRILQTLDRHLTAPAELTLFGRAALALGYAGSPAAFPTTQDVDAILPLELHRLAVFRPATLDLILTKMARGDENDLADIRFLLQHGKLTGDQLRAAFQSARVPDVPEIQELFRAAQPKVLALAG